MNASTTPGNRSLDTNPTMNPNAVFPDTISNDAVLDEVLSQPSPQLVEQLGAGTGDLVVLGAGGKMGPTLVRMAHRAADPADGVEWPQMPPLGTKIVDEEGLAAVEAWINSL